MLTRIAPLRRPPVHADDAKPKELTYKEPPTRRQQLQANRFRIAIRAQVLTLKEHASLKINKIIAITGVGKSEVSNIIKRVKERRYQKEQPLQDAFFTDAKRTGQPIKQTKEAIIKVKETITGSRNNRTLTAIEIARRLKQF